MSIDDVTGPFGAPVPESVEAELRANELNLFDATAVAVSSVAPAYSLASFAGRNYFVVYSRSVCGDVVFPPESPQPQLWGELFVAFPSCPSNRRLVQRLGASCNVGVVLHDSAVVSWHVYLAVLALSVSRILESHHSQRGSDWHCFGALANSGHLYLRVRNSMDHQRAVGHGDH